MKSFGLEYLPALWRKWYEDERGTSMITTIITLPLLAIIFMGMAYMMMLLGVRQSFHHGVLDATNHISENARYWNIDPTGQSKVETDWPPYNRGDLLPADFYDMEARRVITNRLRDVIFFPHDLLTQSLQVTVTEPLLAFAPDAAMTSTVPAGFVDGLCDQTLRDPGTYRDQENVRFIVYASFDLPYWHPFLGFQKDAKPLSIKFVDRLVGYVQCPRWNGRGRAQDKSREIAREGPFMGYRTTATPYYPTITAPPPTDTPVPTMTPDPNMATATPTLTPTP